MCNQNSVGDWRRPEKSLQSTHWHLLVAIAEVLGGTQGSPRLQGWSAFTKGGGFNGHLLSGALKMTAPQQPRMEATAPWPVCVHHGPTPQNHPLENQYSLERFKTLVPTEKKKKPLTDIFPRISLTHWVTFKSSLTLLCIALPTSQIGIIFLISPTGLLWCFLN